jgi:hypothetical protein
MNNTKLRQYKSRIALWHEAGHAVVAHHLSLNVISLGLSPLPHCLVDQAGVDNDDLGLLLCAGAAASDLAFGFEWGYHNDYEIAQSIGDLETYRARAREFVREHAAEIQHIVDLLGDDACDEDEARFNPLGPADPVGISLEIQVEESAPSKKLVRALSIAASFQCKYPKASALFAKAGAKLRSKKSY